MAAITSTFITADRWEMFVTGLGNTLKIALVATAIGVLIGVTIAIIRVYHKETGKLKILDKIWRTLPYGDPRYSCFGTITDHVLRHFLQCQEWYSRWPWLAFGINSGA